MENNFFFLIFLKILFYFYTLQNCISFAKHQTKTGEQIHDIKIKGYVMAAAAVASVVSDSATPETAAHQAPPSLGFSRQEHWSGLPFPSPML